MAQTALSRSLKLPLRYRYTTVMFAMRARCVIAATVCACGLVSACNALETKRPQEKPVIVSAAIEDAPRTYLETMNGLAISDPARQADIFYEVERDYTRTPTTTNTLRYAAALVTPGHPAANLPEGKKLLEALLASPERMSASERTLASVLLSATNEYLQLLVENRRLLETLDSRTRTQTTVDKRAQAQSEENARLRRALADAQQKLDAIKEIERTIIERTPPGGRDNKPGEK
jgi:hypothetical protein